jgi:hypothetical protein
LSAEERREKRGCRGSGPDWAARQLISPRGAAQAPARESRPSGHRAAREKGKLFFFFSFLLSFLYLLVFKLFQIKFFKPIQNKINISTPQNKINATA